MKPTVITANQTGGGGGNGNGIAPGSAGINIPINRDYVGVSNSPQQQPIPHPNTQHFAQQSPSQFYGNYGSPRQQYQQPQQQVPPTNPQQQHFQPSFGFEPDMDMDMDNMFPRSRLGRLHNDHFAGFGGARKRNSLHDPHTHTQTHPTAHSMHPDEDFSHYFDDNADFGFPQFSTMGRRGRVAGGANSHMEPDDDFFNRLPSEFRQYIPETFGARRTAGGVGGTPPQARPQQQYYQQAAQPQQQQQQPQAQVPQTPSKRLCDAAIQTEDPIVGRSEVDCAPPANLNQHGLRNTMDMGVKSVAEQDQALRSHSAPPPEQQQLNQQYQQQQQQQPQQHYGTQTTPPVQANYGPGPQQHQPTPTPLQFHKTYYAPHQQPHPQQQHQQQQKQPTPPPPQTPGGSNIRTIPIFVEGRTEPIINAHKDIPNQSQAQASATAQAYYAPPPSSQQHQQQQRPGPLNTQQAQADQQIDGGVGMTPQTPHTVDSIKKIQDIQRDVLELMGKVEQFKGTRQDKEYAYLDEMLTRNLLKLDTIDTNGKDSIRLARKEAIKCIQASVNVLDAKAEENARIQAGTETIGAAAPEAVEPSLADEAESAAVAEPETTQQLDATKIQEAIPLPPPPSAAVAAADNATELQASNESSATETTSLTTQSSE